MPCSVCARADVVQQIDSLLNCGESMTAVSKQFGISRFSLARHLRHRAAETEPPVSAAQLEISKWLSRAEDEYAKAAQDNDTKSAIAAIASGLRAVETQLRTEEREAASDADSGVDDGRVSISSFDDALALFDAVPSTPVDKAKLQEMLKRARLLNAPDATTIFHKMLECPEFASDLVRWSALWEPAKKGEPDEPLPQEQACAN